MALFGSKNKTEKKVIKSEKKAEKVVAIRESSSTASIVSDVIIRPRITEKSGLANESSNIYTFEVTKLATKGSIAKAVKSIYKVSPLKIRTINLPEKNVVTRGRSGVKSGIKKALVYLKKGDKIEFV